MSDERRKLWLYLYPDEPQQKSAIETIEEIPQRQRSDFFRDSIVAGIALSKLDKRLPALVSMLLQQDSNIDTLVRILKILFPKLDIDSTEDKSTLCAVAWQKDVGMNYNKAHHGLPGLRLVRMNIIIILIIQNQTVRYVHYGLMMKTSRKRIYRIKRERPFRRPTPIQVQKH